MPVTLLTVEDVTKGLSSLETIIQGEKLLEVETMFLGSHEVTEKWSGHARLIPRGGLAASFSRRRRDVKTQ